MMGSHQLWTKGPAMYDEVVRVPLIIRWPDNAPVGVARVPASHIDLVPTLLDFMGLEIPDARAGKSMLSGLRDPSVQLNDAVYAEYGRFGVDQDGFGGFQPMRGVFDGRYKLAVHLLSTDEFYDLDRDPHELANLIDSDGVADVRGRLHDRLLRWMHDTRDPMRGYQWEHRPWRQQPGSRAWDGRGMERQRPADGYNPPVLDYATGDPLEARSSQGSTVHTKGAP
jgi:uncharacterized sulfatase